jgi:hypothetical protein
MIWRSWRARCPSMLQANGAARAAISDAPYAAT